MFKPDSTAVPSTASARPGAGVLPPPLSAPQKSGLSPLAITAICVAAVVAFLAVGVFAAGAIIGLVSLKSNSVKTPQAQPALVARAKARAIPPAPAKSGSADSGVTYLNDKVASEPWSIHVLKIDRSRKDLGFYSAHARDRVLAVSYIRDQAAAVPPGVGEAIAGINGDFYVRDQPTYAGDPRGLQIMNGELISAPDTVCVWFDADAIHTSMK